MRNPQIYRDTETLLEFFMRKSWSESMPKVWRYSIYPKVLDYVLDMLAASADAYELPEGRKENICKILSNLRKVASVARQWQEVGVLSVRQMNYLSAMFDKIETQAVKWRKSIERAPQSENGTDGNTVSRCG